MYSDGIQVNQLISLSLINDVFLSGGLVRHLVRKHPICGTFVGCNTMNDSD